MQNKSFKIEYFYVHYDLNFLLTLVHLITSKYSGGKEAGYHQVNDNRYRTVVN